jgi:glucose/arabinose dehydrogenase
MNSRVIAVGLSCVLVFTGCYSVRPTKGGGKASRHVERQPNPADVSLPSGYRIQVVARGFTFPTGAVFDEQGRLHVVESGYSYGEVWTTPQLVRVDSDGKRTVIARGGRNGPWTGVAFHDGAFFIAEGGALEGGRILRVSADGSIKVIVDGLPSFGDHHTDGPAVSPDGWIYFAQGTASNSGVIGEDNAKFGWLKRRPDFHDIPGADITLAGQNFRTPDVMHKKGRATTGAFVPFGTATTEGQVIRGSMKCSGGILRVRPDGSDLQLVAWGLRNPFGLAFSPDSTLYVTENGYDERGSRPVWGAPDVLWRVQSGLWYGWPDFAAGEPLNTEHFDPPGKPRPKFLLAKHPNAPPKPVTTFGVHASANGLDFSRNATFGHAGDAFVALFGDQVPSVGKALHPVGFKVVRVDVKRGLVHDFAVNLGRENGPASQSGRGGLERPIAVKFTPSGDELIVVDFGVLREDKSGAHPQQGTGVIWKIIHTREAQ